MMSWEDIAFNAQTTASSMASISLDDPSNLISSVPIMYGAGLLTAVSPCVWGLLPLTISYISTAAGDREDKDITLPTVAFAAGLASVFCSLGLIAATVGGAVYGNSGTTSIFLPIFSNAICCVMGFQLLELIDIPFLNVGSAPVAKQSDDEPLLIDGTGQIMSTTKDSKDEQGSLFRTFLLGGSSALVASPCATPVLTSILAFVANSSNPYLGAFLLLFYTLGYVWSAMLVSFAPSIFVMFSNIFVFYFRLQIFDTPFGNGGYGGQSTRRIERAGRKGRDIRLRDDSTLGNPLYCRNPIVVWRQWPLDSSLGRSISCRSIGIRLQVARSNFL